MFDHLKKRSWLLGLIKNDDDSDLSIDYNELEEELGIFPGLSLTDFLSLTTSIKENLNNIITLITIKSSKST